MKYGGNKKSSGFSAGSGRGYGFRGSSPPWPYIGRGRGGLPRCQWQSGATNDKDEMAALRTRAGELKTELEWIQARIDDLCNRSEN